jgi:hypothetical protein
MNFTRCVQWSASIGLTSLAVTVAAAQNNAPPSEPDGRAIVEEAMRRLGDVARATSIRHRTAAPEPMRQAGLPESLTMAWLAPDAFGAEATGSTALRAIHDGRHGWSTEDDGQTWFVEQDESYIAALPLLNPVGAILAAARFTERFERSDRQPVDGRPCFTVTCRRTRRPPVSLVIDAETGEIRSMTSGEITLRLDEWAVERGSRVVRRASIQGAEVPAEFVYTDYEFNAVPDSLIDMPQTVRTRLHERLGYDPLAWREANVFTTLFGSIGAADRLAHASSSVNLPADWHETLGVEPGDLLNDPEIAFLTTNPLGLLLRLRAGRVLDVVHQPAEADVPAMMEIHMNDPKSGLAVWLYAEPGGPLLGFETEWGWLGIDEWMFHEGLRVPARGAIALFDSDEVPVSYTDYQLTWFGAADAHGERPANFNDHTGGGNPGGAIGPARREDAPNDRAAPTLPPDIARAFDLVGAKERLAAISTIRHVVRVPDRVADEFRLPERVTISAGPPHRVAIFASDPRMGDITTVFDGRFAWMTWEGRGGARLTEPALFHLHGIALSPAAFLLSLRASAASFTLNEALDNPTYEHRFYTVQADPVPFMVMVNKATGRIDGAIDAGGRTTRFDGWVERDGLTLPTRATIDDARAGETLVFERGDLEFNAAPLTMFDPPPAVREVIDRMRR